MTENSISARRPRLKVRHYNREVPWLPATSSGAEQAGIEEMLNVYSPFGEIRTVMTALRPGLACDG